VTGPLIVAVVFGVLLVLCLVFGVLAVRQEGHDLEVLVRALELDADKRKASLEAVHAEIQAIRAQVSAGGLVPPVTSPPAGGASATFTPAGPTTYTCIYENCDGAHITTDDLEVAERWLDSHAATVPHDGRWSITFRVEYPGSSLTAFMYRQPILLVGA